MKVLCHHMRPRKMMMMINFHGNDKWSPLGVLKIKYERTMGHKFNCKNAKSKVRK
jgi:hypothetical protein